MVYMFLFRKIRLHSIHGIHLSLSLEQVILVFTTKLSFFKKFVLLSNQKATKRFKGVIITIFLCMLSSWCRKSTQACPEVFLSESRTARWVFHPSFDSSFHIPPISTGLLWHMLNSPPFSQRNEDREISTLSPTAWHGSHQLGQTTTSTSSKLDEGNRFH